MSHEPAASGVQRAADRPASTADRPASTADGPASPANGPASPANGRAETELERYDRNLTELMGELRVALPGVQVLFAFLLVVPFNQRFGSVTPFERRLYFATLLLTLFASILLIAPTVIHRLHFRKGQKAYVVHTGNRLTLAGLLVLAVAMTSAIALVTGFLFGTVTAIVTAVLAVVAFTLVWLALPFGNLRRLS